MAASSTRSKPAAKKTAAKAAAKPAAKAAVKPAAKPAKATGKAASKASSKAEKPAKPAAKPAAAKTAAKASASKAAPASKAAVTKATAKAAASKPEAASKAKTEAKAKPVAAAAKATAKTASKAPAKADKPERVADKPERVADKPERVADKPVAAKADKPAAAPARAAKAPAKPAPARKPARPVDPDDDDDDLDSGDDVRETPTQATRNMIDPADVIRFEPEAPPAPRKKSVLEVADEDEDFEEDPPLPTADDVHGLLDRLRKAAQFGGEALEDLNRLIEQLEQIDDPAVMPRLLGLLEDNDPYGIYWNVLYVLEKFDDSYLRALLDGIEALHARAPQWAYTCIIRILNTRGDEDDCTAAFERLVNERGPETRQLVLKVLRELSADPETDHDQKQNIARTISAIGGASVGDPSPGSAD